MGVLMTIYSTSVVGESPHNKYVQVIRLTYDACTVQKASKHKYIESIRFCAQVQSYLHTVGILHVEYCFLHFL